MSLYFIIRDGGNEIQPPKRASTTNATNTPTSASAGAWRKQANGNYTSKRIR